jgi:tetratricopeptide (TPR) repeat protein
MQGRHETTEKSFFSRRSTKLCSVITATAGFFGSGYARADVSPDQIRSIEVRTWTSDENELDQVEHDLVRIIQVQPNSAYAHHLLSHLMVRLYSKNPGDMYLLKQASDLAQQAIDLDPTFPGGYASYAHLLDLMGNTDAAVKLLGDAEAAGVEPNWRFYLTRARLTADVTSTDTTLNLLRTALSFTETQPDVIVPYIIAILNTQKSPQAVLSSLEDWYSKYPNDLFALSLGLAYSEGRHYIKAEAVYKSILARNPEHLEAAVNLAVLQYKQLKSTEKAITTLEGALAKKQGHLNVASENMIRLHLGAAYLREKKFDAARGMFDRTVARDPSNVAVLDFVTNAYRGENAHQELVRFLEGVTRNIAGVGIYYALLGETLSEKLGKHAQAVSAYNNAITLDPRRSDFYNGLGLAIYRDKNYDTALKAFVKATEIDPSDATAHYNEACMLSLLGQTDDAISSLAEALTLDPRLLKSAANDDDFRNLRGSVKFRNLMTGNEQKDVLRPDTEIGH